MIAKAIIIIHSNNSMLTLTTYRMKSYNYKSKFSIIKFNF